MKSRNWTAKERLPEAPGVQHTPLPWEAQEPDEVDVFVPIIGVRLGEDGQPLETPTNGLVGGATLFPTDIDAEDFARAKANAAFIVRAANCHYDLLKACSDWIDWLKPDSPWRDDAAAHEERMLAAMRAAIAKATGEQQ